MICKAHCQRPSREATDMFTVLALAARKAHNLQVHWTVEAAIAAWVEDRVDKRLVEQYL